MTNKGKFNVSKRAIVNSRVANDNANVADNVTEANVGDGNTRVHNEYKPNKFVANAADRYPEHIVAIATIVKNNAEIRRFTALGILNYLLQKGEISGDKRYVSFKWNKFTVKWNGLARDFYYTEPFFLNALVASFSSFSASAQKAITKFCNMEAKANDALSQEEVDNIVKLNEEYQQNNGDVDVDDDENQSNDLYEL